MNVMFHVYTVNLNIWLVTCTHRHPSLHPVQFCLWHGNNCNDIYCSLSISVGSLYVRKFFKEEAKTKAMEMVEDIRREFIHILMNVDWMDEKTK